MKVTIDPIKFVDKLDARIEFYHQLMKMSAPDSKGFHQANSACCTLSEVKRLFFMTVDVPPEEEVEEDA